MLELDPEKWNKIEERLTRQARVWLSQTFPLGKVDATESALALLKQAETKRRGARFFWQTPTKSLTLVGIEQMLDIRLTTPEDRVTTFEKRKKELEQDLYRLGEPLVGSGPLFFGGLSFDTLPKEKTEWTVFGHGYFRVPRYLWTVQEDGQASLTWNVLIENQEQYNTQRQQLLAYAAEINERMLGQNLAPQPAAGWKVVQQEEREVAAWQAQVAAVVAEIKAQKGLKKVVMSRKLALSFTAVPPFADVMQNLAQTQTGTYLIGLEVADEAYVSATPERLLAADEHFYSSACVAGTVGRGKTPAEDQALGASLLQDSKNEHEHDFVVAQIEEDLRKIGQSEPQVAAQKTLLKTRDVQHLFLTIQTERGEEPRLLEAVATLNPTPALGGVPTAQAMKMIANQEKTSRGLYGAPLGWLNDADQGEFAVAIRSAKLSGKTAWLYAGCGIVEDSLPSAEVVETRLKFRPLLRALGGDLDE